MALSVSNMFDCSLVSYFFFSVCIMRYCQKKKWGESGCFLSVPCNGLLLFAMGLGLQVVPRQKGDDDGDSGSSLSLGSFFCPVFTTCDSRFFFQWYTGSQYVGREKERK
ncbi:hypothetical protein F4809DRAFT_277772 [Biscogniauxia mediterranea]|nr:hypothetical protein F4809DRAFT_277772 [Biscogniauxia mediterranea]